MQHYAKAEITFLLFFQFQINLSNFYVSDFQAERNWLMKYAVPELRTFCQELGLDFQVTWKYWIMFCNCQSAFAFMEYVWENCLLWEVYISHIFTKNTAYPIKVCISDNIWFWMFLGCRLCIVLQTGISLWRVCFFCLSVYQI